MDEKISLKAVEQYSGAYAIKVCDAFFSNKELITGPEILRLCEVRQVNLFVIQKLLKAWQQESQKYKSPYFDYEAEEVKEVYQQFQNVLSNHIAIAKDHFVPLLQKGVSQTVYLVLDPYDYFADTLDRQGKGVIKTAELKNEIKYLKINRAPLEKLAQRLEEKKIASLSGNEAFALLDQILEEVHFTPEDVEPYIAQFSKILHLPVDRLYEVKEEKKPEVRQVAVNRPRPTAQSTVNEKLQTAPKTTVADNFQKVSSLKDSLTINQKFMFTKMLFGGDFDQFSQAVAQIDGLETLTEAERYVHAHFSHWDKESEEYEEFVEMLNKRFA